VIKIDEKAYAEMRGQLPMNFRVHARYIIEKYEAERAKIIALSESKGAKP